MLVITGPNGNVGTELVRAVLRQPVLPHRIASRHPQKLREQFGRMERAVRENREMGQYLQRNMPQGN